MTAPRKSQHQIDRIICSHVIRARYSLLLSWLLPGSSCFDRRVKWLLAMRTIYPISWAMTHISAPFLCYCLQGRQLPRKAKGSDRRESVQKRLLWSIGVENTAPESLFSARRCFARQNRFNARCERIGAGHQGLTCCLCTLSLGFFKCCAVSSNPVKERWGRQKYVGDAFLEGLLCKCCSPGVSSLHSLLHTMTAEILRES